MLKYIIILIAIVIFIYSYSVNINQSNENFSWTSNWTKLDHITRKNNDCNPINIESIDDKYLIWTVPSSCENGLPHTRYDNVIVLPNNLPFYIKTNVIEHEKIHLHQRKNEEKWKAFYKSYWKYEIYKKHPINMPLEIIEKRRSNPDTDANIWACWNEKWWSVPIYNDIDDLHLSNISIKWWNIDTNQISAYPPNEWIDFFGNSLPQAEHPHEISAVFISQYIKNNKQIMSEAMKLLVDNWNFEKETFIF